VIIDVVIVLVVIATAYVGFQRGMVQPLLAEVFALTVGLLILHNRSAFASLTEALFHANILISVLIGLVLVGLAGYLGARLGGAIHKMPVVRGVDGFFGIWLQVLFGIGLCYVLISGIIVMERAFAPLTAQTVNARQLATLERQLRANAFTSSLVDGHDLQPFDARAGKPGGVRVADLPAIGALRGVQRDFLQPQLAASRLAPYVMNVGRRIPGLGPFGPTDLPRRS
jgi:hypothetical protein